MNRLPPTRPSLVFGLQEPDNQQAWTDFVSIYAPVLLGYASRCQLQGADAEDLVQDVLQSVHAAIGRLDYDPHKGSFRGWLFTIARNRVRSLARKRQRQEVSGGTVVRDLVHAEIDPIDDQEQWDLEYEKHLFQWAVEKVKPDFREATWQAFWETAVNDRPADEVAKELNLSTGAVYVAKSRVLSKIREVIQAIEAE